jgi:hypothetical protein
VHSPRSDVRSLQLQRDFQSHQARKQGAKRLSSQNGPRYTPEQGKRLLQIHERLVEARRELDALIGDAYLRPRANIVPVHFLDLASAVEKLRWAEKEWREIDKELEARPEAPPDRLLDAIPEPEPEPSRR